MSDGVEDNNTNITEPKSEWSYNTESLDASGDNQEYFAPEIQPVSWTASEYVTHDKSMGWYILVTFAVVTFAGLIYFFDSANGLFSPILVVVAGIIFMVAASRKPDELNYVLDEFGLHIGKKLYSYAQFKSFSLVQEGVITSIVFTPLQRFMPPLTIYFDPNDQEKIINALSAYLPVESKKLDIIDNLMRKIRF